MNSEGLDYVAQSLYSLSVGMYVSFQLTSVHLALFPLAGSYCTKFLNYKNTHARSFNKSLSSDEFNRSTVLELVLNQDLMIKEEQRFASLEHFPRGINDVEFFCILYSEGNAPHPCALTHACTAG